MSDSDLCGGQCATARYGTRPKREVPRRYSLAARPRAIRVDVGQHPHKAPRVARVRHKHDTWDDGVTGTEPRGPRDFGVVEQVAHAVGWPYETGAERVGRCRWRGHL